MVSAEGIETFNLLIKSQFQSFYLDYLGLSMSIKSIAFEEV